MGDWLDSFRQETENIRKKNEEIRKDILRLRKEKEKIREDVLRLRKENEALRNIKVNNLDMNKIIKNNPTEMANQNTRQDAIAAIQNNQGDLNENIEKVADACVQEYKEKYGEFSEDELWLYLSSEYLATGEGRTICLMLTQGSPFSAVLEFYKIFGAWYLYGLDFKSKEDFYIDNAYYLPPIMMRLAKNENCYKEFHTKIHTNLS